MKRILSIVLTLTAVATLQVSVRAGGHGCACGAVPVVEPCSPQRWHFRIERVECPGTAETPTRKLHAVSSKTCDTERSATRLVPVSITDPCTGCTRTEMREEPYVEKCKTTITEIVPVDECGTKKEAKPRVCTTIYMECRPFDCAPKGLVPAVAK